MNTLCPSCLTTNRIPEDRIQEDAKCGRCGHELFDGEVINASQASFDSLLNDDLPVVVDFWAPWCGPCVNFAPIFEDVAQEREREVRFVKVDTEAEQELSARFGIRSIPTIMVFKKGQRIDMLNGALPKASFDQWLSEVLAKNS
ncbi:thioredoxin TrxC [Budviciaceae bacterium BWR-B9]|uniref:Thioredoxin n=1 Tax=Limnobaculum allomyrinae TaxID=2791986 RepID=A0ABS1IVU0_9GAMM|nr:MULTISPECIES: thioredoxin TrxC [Limnobaculum]MBK5145878.1 thioredoxin TrxC [Limnobaculum allomyrinae]MBV7693889.1 thioredoxin TrxC [Limnobaculum sp. M2-1]